MQVWSITDFPILFKFVLANSKVTQVFVVISTHLPMSQYTAIVYNVFKHKKLISLPIYIESNLIHFEFKMQL